MALNLYDYLTELDNKRIENYIKTWGVEDYVGNDIYLSHWRDSNKKLFRLLGGQLIYSTPVKIKKDKDILKKDMSFFLDNNAFYGRLVDKYYETDYYYPIPHRERKDNWLLILNSDNLITNKLPEDFFIQKKTDDEETKSFKLQKGTKTIKALKKIIDFKYPDDEELQDLFEEFRLEHSRILNDLYLEGDLCFSIHPLDFLTMSDNNMNWSSCMSWQENGCYHTGTVEMMNSNVVICVYLKTNNPAKENFYFCKEEEKAEEYSWNNKKWRQLFYCNKDIIVSGKAYPYYNKDLTIKALETLRELARINWNQTYTYGIEQYSDMKHINTLFKMERNHQWIQCGDTKKHNIIFDTNTMYNDIFNDHFTQYWCVRNKVKKNVIINLSGKVPCAKCGCDEVVKRIDYDSLDSFIYNTEDITEDDEYDYNTRFSGARRLICPKCYNKRKCYCCGTGYRVEPSVPIKIVNENTGKYEEVTICKACFTKLTICPSCNKPYLNDYDMRHKIFGLYEGTNENELDFVNNKDLFVICDSNSKGVCLHMCAACRSKYNTHTHLFHKDYYTIRILDERVKEGEYSEFYKQNIRRLLLVDFDLLYNELVTEEDLIKIRQKIN